MTIMEKLKSRKFWFALCGTLLPIIAQALTQELPIDQAITLSVGVVVSYIIGQGYVDAALAGVSNVVPTVDSGDE